MNSEHKGDKPHAPNAPSEDGRGGNALPKLTAREKYILYESIFSTLPIGISVHDEHGRLVLSNDTALNINESVQPPTSGSDNVSINHEKSQRTFDTLHTPLHVSDRQLLLSTSIDVTERERFESELARRAYFDELTGLANRALLQKKIEETLQSKETVGRFALAFFDLDNFKHINDFYNHAIGDALLVTIAQRILNCIRTSDTLARISGDEFVLIVDPTDDDQKLRTFINGILHQLKRPFYIEDHEIFTSASIGVSIYPDHGTSYETLRRNADTAMYQAKHSSKGSAAIYDPGMGQDIANRMELEQRLRVAIRDRHFRCAFQPKVDIHSQQVVGFEALIRWCDEAGVISPPSHFIGLAVELGLIDAITHLVLSESIKAVDKIDDAFGRDVTISINVAAKQACEIEFMKSFVESLKNTGRPERFILEVTEDAFVATGQFQRLIMPILRDAGVRVSIDDFGTGYSSLSALADIAVDEVKIDRSFITAIHQRPRNQSILKAIESLGHALGITVVAEGVETFEELAFLQAATRIRYAQGYYFAKPFFIGNEHQSTFAGVELRPPEISRSTPNMRARTSSRTSRW
jgi:diguanylate cyclase (GGDEF)-like protein